MQAGDLIAAFGLTWHGAEGGVDALWEAGVRTEPWLAGTVRHWPEIKLARVSRMYRYRAGLSESQVLWRSPRRSGAEVMQSASAGPPRSAGPRRRVSPAVRPERRILHES